VLSHTRKILKKEFLNRTPLEWVFPRGVRLLCSFLWLSVSLPAQTDYKSIFVNDWDKAQSFISENESWMRPVCEKYDVEFSFAAAIVFPELVRYSALRDRIEISLLKTLYINLGDEYADFSVGPFQMKPSFAELVHEKAGSLAERKIRNMFTDKRPSEDLKKYRASIVADLEDNRIQLNYLIAFIRICESAYGKKWSSESEKLRFFSTAYNCGLKGDITYIYSMEKKRFFSTSLVPSVTYSYSDISIYWFNLFATDRTGNLH
jgi:hypothetical protein